MLGEGEREQLYQTRFAIAGTKDEQPFERLRHIGEQLGREGGEEPERLGIRYELGELLDVAPVEGGEDDTCGQQQPEKPRSPIGESIARQAAGFLFATVIRHPAPTPVQPLRCRTTVKLV